MSMTEKLQSMIAQLKSMEIYLNDLTAKEATVLRLIEEGKLASDALRGLEGKEQMNVLMPIGMGVYTHSIINPNSKFLVNIGAGISIEKNREDALTFVENRLRELEVALNNIISQKREIELKMEQTRKETNELLIKIQQEQK